jgi:hypothetical protein
MSWLTDRLRWIGAPWRELSDLQVRYLQLHVQYLALAKRVAALEARLGHNQER